jgi:hypothetical protein
VQLACRRVKGDVVGDNNVIPYIGKQGLAVKTIFLQFRPFVIASGKRTGKGQEKEHWYQSSTHRNKWLRTGNGVIKKHLSGL